MRATFRYLTRSLQGQVYAELLYGCYDESGAILDNREAMDRAYRVGRRLALGLGPEPVLPCRKRSTDWR